MSNDFNKGIIYPSVSTASNVKFFCTYDEVLALTMYLLGATSMTFVNTYNSLFATPSELIHSIKAYPFNLSKLSILPPVDSIIIIGGLSDKTVNTNVHSVVPGQLKQFISVGEWNINSHFNSYLDFSPYTQAKLYIPFVGYIDLPINEIMPLPNTTRKVNLDMSLDLETGKATFITSLYYSETDTPKIMTITEAQLGVDISFSSSNAFERGKNMLSTGVTLAGGIASVGVGIATGNPIAIVGGATAILGGANSAFKNAQEHYQIGQTGATLSGLALPSNPHIKFIRPKPLNTSYIYDETYGAGIRKKFGAPLCENCLLSELSGFTQVGMIHLENISEATATELSEIEKLLKTGVILPLE